MKQSIIFLCFLFSINLVYSQQDTLLFKYRREAVGYQQSIQMAKHNLEGANSLIESAKAGYLPRLDADGSYNFFGNPLQLGQTDDSPNGQELSHMYELGLWVSQPLYTGGYLNATRDLAMARSGAAEDFIALSEQNTMLESDALYLSVVTKKEISSLTMKYREAIADFEKVIQDRVDEEIVALNELYQVKVRYNDAQYEVIRIEKQYRVSLMSLNRIIGVPLETQSLHMDSLLVVDWQRPAEDMVSKALQLRPEITMKENEILMDESTEKITASHYNPKVNVGAGATYGAPSPGLLTEPGGNYMVTARLAVPIFTWGQKNDEIFAKQKITDQSKLALDQTKDIISLQVTGGYYELQQSQVQVDFAFSALGNASQNRDVMLDRYAEGLSSVLEVLDAQLFWQKSYLNYIEAKFELNMAYSAYLKAMGEMSISQ